MKVLVLHTSGLNLLVTRETDVFGSDDFDGFVHAKIAGVGGHIG